MDEYIKRKDAVSAICFGCNLEFSDRHCEPPDCEIRHAIEAVNAADVVPRSVISEIFAEIEYHITLYKKGHFSEKSLFENISELKKKYTMEAKKGA